MPSIPYKHPASPPTSPCDATILLSWWFEKNEGGKGPEAAGACAWEVGGAGWGMGRGLVCALLNRLVSTCCPLACRVKEGSCQRNAEVLPSG